MENPLPAQAGNRVTANHPITRGAMTVALAALLLGCREQRPATFALRVEADPADPLRIEVVVAASDAKVWQSRQRSSPSAGDWENVLSLRVNDRAVVSGDYEVIGDRLRLTPRYRLLAGETYRATFDPRTLGRIPMPTDSTVLTATYRAPASPTNTTAGSVAIYPSGDRLPANHLKFYLVFPAPMRRGEFLQHLKLIDDRGAEVAEPFRETELWSDDERRLTLWFHPGRQKTGVNLNLELGPVLLPGRSYRLIVSGDWPTQTGATLGRTIEKEFTAGAAEHAQLSLAGWRVKPPAAGSRDPLEVKFPRPLDWALLSSQLHVCQRDGTKVNGQIAVGEAETSWKFSPREPWADGNYQLNVATVLEDLAGNNLARPFEVDVEKTPELIAAKAATLEFTIAPVVSKK